MSDNYWFVVADICARDRDALLGGVYALLEEHAADWVGDTDRGGLVNVRFAAAGTDPATVKVEAQAFLIRALNVSANDVEVVNLTRESDMQLFENI